MIHNGGRGIAIYYPLFFNDTQLSPSPTLNILGLSFVICNLNWKLHISSLAKTASMKLGVLSRLRQFYSPPQLLTLYRGLIRPCMEYASHVWGGSTHTALLNRVESKAFRLINSYTTVQDVSCPAEWSIQGFSSLEQSVIKLHH